ncbi:MAG: hypothetical protein HUJ22_03830 [Gracilimonas sp.]|uniref:energy transducer TonB n=1 Tax=Gracilimonas sp. TaxID=1974203 RepID=UPI0019AC1960|nr:energy transducer TonB [Gracilimonas sp.]MBD3615680.1 hypothetical protein [Gracilimonas sp.]
MINKIRDIYYDELEHQHRFMLSLIYAELIVLMILKFWPAQVAPPENFEYSYNDEAIYVERAIITRQSSAPAAPPKPRVPVPVPNDEVIEEEIDFPEFEDVFSKLDADGDQGLSSVGGEGELVGSPERPPGLIRIVEPTTPDAAKRANIKAQIIVTFLVGTDGEVEDAFISEIRLYDGDSYKVVDRIGYGLMEATLEAALKWRFRPARDQGAPVKTYVENSFNIGF